MLPRGGGGAFRPVGRQIRQDGGLGILLPSLLRTASPPSPARLPHPSPGSWAAWEAHLLPGLCSPLWGRGDKRFGGSPLSPSTGFLKGPSTVVCAYLRDHCVKYCTGMRECALRPQSQASGCAGQPGPGARGAMRVPSLHTVAFLITESFSPLPQRQRSWLRAASTPEEPGRKQSQLNPLTGGSEAGEEEVRLQRGPRHREASGARTSGESGEPGITTQMWLGYTVPCCACSRGRACALRLFSHATLGLSTVARRTLRTRQAA